MFGLGWRERGLQKLLLCPFRSISIFAWVTKPSRLACFWAHFGGMDYRNVWFTGKYKCLLEVSIFEQFQKCVRSVLLFGVVLSTFRVAVLLGGVVSPCGFDAVRPCAAVWLLCLPLLCLFYFIFAFLFCEVFAGWLT